MDLGIAGRRALVCAASKGLGRGCAEALAREGVDVTILARTEADVGARPRRSAPRRAGRSRGSPATSPRPRDARRRSPRVPIRTSSSTTPAVRRPATSATGTATRGSRARRQHADADRAHPRDGRRHDRAQVRPHRQHHVVGREGADRHPRPVQRRAQRPDRLRRGHRAQGRAPRRHDQQPAARQLRHRPPARHDARAARRRGQGPAKP